MSRECPTEAASPHSARLMTEASGRRRLRGRAFSERSSLALELLMRTTWVGIIVVR